MKHHTTLIMIVFILMVASVMAEPTISTATQMPTPIGGLQTLARNTQYPEFAARERMEGDVLLNFTVNKNGEVSQVSIIKSGGDLFDASARDAVLRTEWKPAEQSGQPVSVQYALPFKYRMK